MTQTEAVLEVLRERGPEGLTSLEALRLGLGSRLAARVGELKAQGHPITSSMETVATSTGTARVAVYRLITQPPARPAGQLGAWF